MTSEERVKAKHGDAACQRVELRGKVNIWILTVDGCRGIGATEAEAWDDAASNLPPKSQPQGYTESIVGECGVTLSTRFIPRVLPQDDAGSASEPYSEPFLGDTAILHHVEYAGGQPVWRQTYVDPAPASAEQGESESVADAKSDQQNLLDDALHRYILKHRSAYAHTAREIEISRYSFKAGIEYANALTGTRVKSDSPLSQ